MLQALCVFMNGDSLLQEFRVELEKHGFSQRIVWLHCEQIRLTKSGLYIYALNGFPSDEQVRATYDKHSASFECGATFMLVAASDRESYCTLLMDSFGADTDREVQKNIYIWANEPYVKNFEIVCTRLGWLLCKLKPAVLSSLDYAFALKQAYT